jgi:hypothetical protein
MAVRAARERAVLALGHQGRLELPVRWEALALLVAEVAEVVQGL